MDQQCKKQVTVCDGGVMDVGTAYYIPKTVPLSCLSKKEHPYGIWKSVRISSRPLLRSSTVLDLMVTCHSPVTTFDLTMKEPEGKEGPSLKSSGSGLPDLVNGPAEILRTIGTAQTMAQLDQQLFTRNLLSYNAPCSFLNGSATSAARPELVMGTWAR
ncbi:hypothetical protein ACFE04_022507 [Oxalis oulophora]